MTSRIADALVTTDALADVFSDGSALQAMLDVEAALARAQAALDVIPRDAAEAISRAAIARDFDATAIARDARASATVAIPLVDALRARVGSVAPDAARFVHWGATSQDIVDTALMLLVNRACDVMSADHRTLSATLRALSDRHKGDVMLGRTLLQPASPITFGLKVAGWFAAEGRGWQRVETRCREAAVLQFGGASGTLASVGDQGLPVAEAWARELGLRCPPGPWHAYADNIAALVAACGVYAGTLGKIARDITLLMQFEVGELHEPGGGSSSMPQKRNPSGSVVALAAAARLSGLVATAMSTLTQEHERAAGAWQVEWPTVADALQATGASLAAMAQVASGLHVDPARMRANLDATHGTVLTERVTQSATRALGHDRARALVKAAIDRARGEGVSFLTAVRGAPELASVLSSDDLASLDDPRRHLGLAEVFRQRLLASIESR